MKYKGLLITDVIRILDRGEGVSKNITQNNQGGGIWPKITDDIDKEAGRKKLIHSESQTTNHHKGINSFSLTKQV